MKKVWLRLWSLALRPLLENARFFVFMGLTMATCIVLEPWDSVRPLALVELLGDLYMVCALLCLLPRRVRRFVRGALTVGTYVVCLVDSFLYERTGAPMQPAVLRAIADASAKPCILYNIPGRTGVDISLDAYRALAEHPRIAGVKEASGDVVRCARILEASGDSLAVWAGNDAEAVPVMAEGGAGVFSVVSNLFPHAVRRLCRMAETGDFAGAARLQRELLPSELQPLPEQEPLLQAPHRGPGARSLCDRGYAALS